MKSSKTFLVPVFIVLGIVLFLLFGIALINSGNNGSTHTSPSYSSSYDDSPSYNYSASNRSSSNRLQGASSTQLHYGENQIGGKFAGVTDGNAGFGVATDGYGNGYVGATDGNGAGFFGVSDGNAGIGVATDGAGNSSLIYTDEYGNSGIIPIE